MGLLRWRFERNGKSQISQLKHGTRKSGRFANLPTCPRCGNRGEMWVDLQDFDDESPWSADAICTRCTREEQIRLIKEGIACGAIGDGCTRKRHVCRKRLNHEQEHFCLYCRRHFNRQQFERNPFTCCDNCGKEYNHKRKGFTVLDVEGAMWELCSASCSSAFMFGRLGR